MERILELTANLISSALLITTITGAIGTLIEFLIYL